MQWDVHQYERFQDERARPFHELVGRIGPRPVTTLADLGCGAGELTATLLKRWPEATAIGVDNSREMLASAAKRPEIPGLSFVEADLSHWNPPSLLDLIVSNATLHWLPDQQQVLTHMANMLRPTGSLAVQLPANFDQPSHTLITDLLARPPWNTQVTAAIPNMPPPLDWYVETLWKLGFAAVDAWSTTYYHILNGPDAVLEWVKGSALRPILTQLSMADRDAFLAALREPMRAAYPARERGTILSFRRLFFVAHRF